MKTVSLTFILLATLSACTEEERPAAQAKHALDAAHNAANQATKHAQDMADKAQKMLEDQ